MPVILPYLMIVYMGCGLILPALPVSLVGLLICYLANDIEGIQTAKEGLIFSTLFTWLPFIIIYNFAIKGKLHLP